MKKNANLFSMAFFILFLASGILLAGCSSPKESAAENISKEMSQTQVQQPEQEAPQIANPASVFCKEHNGTLEIRNDEKGGQVGYCILYQGIECEEWSYYQGKCPVKEAEKPKILSIPKSVEDNCIGFDIGMPEEITMVSEIGGGWIRPNLGTFSWGFIEPEKNKFDFSMTDKYVQEAQEKNIAIVATIFPYADWDQAQCHSSECIVSPQDYPEDKMGWKIGIPKSRCIPCNFINYNLFITKLIERYDGDGVDDMPGLKIPIKYWEVLNEPEMNGTGLAFFYGNPDEYAEIFKKTRDSIKESCPDCKVLHGGAAGIQDYMINYWAKVFGNKIDFDIANIHFIKRTDLSTLNVKDFKSLLQKNGISKDIWVTEAEYNSDSEIASSVTNALNAGASKIFFTQFEIGHFGLPQDGKYSAGYNNIASKCK